MPQPHIIILNGVGSVGKSSTAQALQAITLKPFLHVAMDTFIDMPPQGMFERGDREAGLARWQYDRVHKDLIYDLEKKKIGVILREKIDD